MKKLIFLILGLLLVPSFIFGQEEQLSTKSKKAAKYYMQGRQAYDMRQNDQAEQNLLMAIKEDPGFIEAHALLGYVYTDEHKYPDAISQLKQAIQINANFFPNIYFSLAQLQLDQGSYDEALANYQKFKTYNFKDKNIEWHTDMGIADCKYAAEAIKHPVPFNPVNMGINVNSQYNEYFPAMTADGETFLFTRDIPDNAVMEGHQEDFYVSYKINGQWTGAVSLGPPLNTQNNEGAPTLSADGHLLIFTGCDRQDGHGSCDLYYSFKVGNNWTAGRNLGRPVNTANWESQPCLASDGKTLYFIRGSESAQGVQNQDIYVTQLTDSGTWSNPQRLSDTINTPGREESVFIAADNQTLYFSSDGHPGMGGLDIFMSRRLPNGRWGIPKNLGYPINTSKDDNSFMVDPNGHTAYFSSDREGGYGLLDFYSYELYDSIRPQPITYVKGKVYDAKTGKPLIALFNLADLETTKTVVQSSSAPGDGTFLVCLPINKNYALNVSRKGYLFYSENFSLQGVNASSTSPYMMDIPLQPIDTGATIVLKNVFYETDKYDLKPQSTVELNKVVSFLKANPNVKIEVSGHTDNTGSAEHNNSLSKNRAKSVYDYLISQGIAADRLTYKGYGATKPIADNATEAGKAKNRRTEMKIIAT
jgi:outer membrane protein OmpA-like peptidoglycan-associated protein/tetratricopeptide (TPR) repeat protein